MFHMHAQLEINLKLSKDILPCIRAAFDTTKDGSFQRASDVRGQAYVFDRQVKLT